MLARVGKLERGSGVTSPWLREYGTLDNLAAAFRGMMDAGTLDRRDGEDLIAIIFRWHHDGVWGPVR
jgi:hypothetical protein